MISRNYVVNGSVLDRMVGMVESLATGWDEDVCRSQAREILDLLEKFPSAPLETVREQSASSLRQYRELSDAVNIEGVWGRGDR